MGVVGDIREANRASPYFNHLTMISESIGMLAWITIDQGPADHIRDTFDTAQYFGNTVIKNYKEKYASLVAISDSADGLQRPRSC